MFPLNWIFLFIMFIVIFFMFLSHLINFVLINPKSDKMSLISKKTKKTEIWTKCW